MKRGTINIYLFLIITLVLLTTILAQEQLKLLEEYTHEEWTSLNLESKNQVWKDSLSQRKISFLKTNYPLLSDIQLKGFDHETLTWQEGEILGNEKTWVDLTNLPEGLKNLEYDGEKFIYDFGDGKIETEVGSINSENKIVGIDGLEGVKISLSMNGEVKISSDGTILFKDVSISIGEDKHFFQIDRNSFSELKIISKDQFLMKNIELEKKDLVKVRSYEEPVFFSLNNEIPEEYSKQFVKIDLNGEDASMQFYGKERMEIEVERKFNEIKGIGEEGKGVKIINGNVPIEFDGISMKFPRSVRDAKYTIENIVNELNPENNFRLQKFKYIEKLVEVKDESSILEEDSIVEVGDKKYRIHLIPVPADKASGDYDAGSFLMNTKRSVTAGKGKFEYEFARGVPIEIASYKLGFDRSTLEGLPEGIETIEEFSEELSDSGKVLSFELKRPLTEDQILDQLKSHNIEIGAEIRSRLESYQGRYENKNIFEIATEAIEQGRELERVIEGFIETGSRIQDSGRLVLNYPEETLDMIQTIKGIGYKKTKTKHEFDPLIIVFDSRKDPALMRIEYPNESPKRERVYVQRIYPQEFLNKVINQIGGRLVEKAFTEYQENH